MASQQVIATRRARAVGRLEKVKGELQSAMSLTFEEQPITNKDKDVAQIQRVENVANLLEAIKASLAEKPKVKTKKV